MKSGDLRELIARRDAIKAKIEAGDKAAQLWPLERRELMQEMVTIGGIPPGSLRGQVTRSMQVQIRQLFADGASLRDIGQMLGYSRATVCSIKNGTYPSIRED
jgi:DNA-binding NarL/FixJ family response regulator